MRFNKVRIFMMPRLTNPGETGDIQPCHHLRRRNAVAQRRTCFALLIGLPVKDGYLATHTRAFASQLASNASEQLLLCQCPGQIHLPDLHV